MNRKRWGYFVERSRCVAALSLCVVASVAAGTTAEANEARWARHAEGVTITRDEWGIAHVRGRSDADAVFGMIYAQAEDDFNRVETNYIDALGRSAEVEGESLLYADLRMRLFIDPSDLEARYAASPAWLQALMTAWADGLNYFLRTHPDVTPRLIRNFEPWMALSFSEGSIGGDISRVSVPELQAFYGKRPSRQAAQDLTSFASSSGSNGFAIAPANTTAGKALLLINPHTTFFFRSELQMTSEEGLNAYGAATWGQFFLYQGFNDRLGWMHTSSGVDVIDEFAETIVRKGRSLHYRYGKELRPIETRQINIRYRTPGGSMSSRTFTTYRTHHGPIVRAAEGKWISVSLMHRPVEALQQSFLRTKARDLKGYLKITELQANSSNNTIYADADGNIAYLHPQFIPKRDDRFDYSHPVDGSDPATDWQGLTASKDIPQAINPRNGWVMNTNNWPYSAAGSYSPREADYPRYMDRYGENPRGLHALRLLSERRDFSLPSLIEAAYDPYLPAFARLIPALVCAYDRVPEGHALKYALRDQVALLRSWDYRWSVESEAAALAIFWGDELWLQGEGAKWKGLTFYDDLAERAPGERLLKALARASDRLVKDFGSWKVPWGKINRYQRLAGGIEQKFDDHAPSRAVGFTSYKWGSLAAFEAERHEGTTHYYGTSGNSFVAVVEFGEKVRARAISTGGASGDPKSVHFDDQAERYAAGDLREVYFYPDQLRTRVEGPYHPGASN